MATDHDIQPEHKAGENERTASTRTMELVVAGLFMAGAAVVIEDSWRAGAGWGEYGPKPGYFPFYVGIIMFGSSAIIFLYNLFRKTPDRSNFVSRSGLRMVLKVLAPSAGFVILTYFLGLYVAAGIYIAFFMVWIGRYSLVKAIPLGIAVPVFLFWLFETMFLIPLPKGPLETWLGF